jgi:two-component system, OmpR family, sensor histidine kinase KdpD
MTNDRPNPDDLLARVKTNESASRRGKLKIFFGYAAGVGKTYAMLEAAARERAAGTDVVVGYVEPHGRPETEALLHGLEVIPPKLVPYRGINLRELDLDAALARHPALILVDELAHTNAEGLRHSKRWQDVEELLEAGIDVWTTLNVQHVESLNDVIGQITGIVVHETIPDSVLERARDFELVDITPEELIDRLKQGKVYVPLQAERALMNYFQKANLVALRELSLRQAAQRLSKDVEAARRQKASHASWATNERLLVCIGPSPSSAKLIRTAKRMAAAFGADWLAVAVEQHGARAKKAVARQRVAQHLRLAEQLGAETHTLIGGDIAQAVLDFARSRNVTKIVVGKTFLPWWKRLLSGTVVDALLDRSGDIDVYVIRGAPEGPSPPRVPQRRPAVVWINYVWTAAVVAICGLLGWTSHSLRLTEANTAMVFLLGVAWVAYRFGRGPAIAAAVANVLVFDFFFVPPYLTFSVHDAQYLLTFAVMLLIGLIISALTARKQDQLQAAQQIQGRTAALFQLTKQLTEIAGLDFLIHTAGSQLSSIFDGEVVIFTRANAGPVELRYGKETKLAANQTNGVVAQWVADHEQLAGAGTDTLPNATGMFAPLVGSQRTLGAVGVKPNDSERFADPEQRRLLQTCVSLIALSFERDQSVLEASEAQVQVHAEQLRNALLSSVSHDLRTPLAAIAGASSSLLDAATSQNDKTRAELLQTVVDESHRMARLVDNLLDMTKLSSGRVALNKQWHVLEEIVGSALARLRRELADHQVRVHMPSDLPLLHLDGVLMEQVFFNLLENACQYSPAGSQIEISAQAEGHEVRISVADNGPGLPAGGESRVFEKFYRGSISTADSRRGAGLGLAICQAIVDAHGGQISAANRPSGGAEFVVRLPSTETAPRVHLDELEASSAS